MARTVIIALPVVLTAALATPARQLRQRQAICLLRVELAAAMAAVAMAAAVRFVVRIIIAIHAIPDFTVIHAARCWQLSPFRSALLKNCGCALPVIGPTLGAAKSTGVNGATRPAPIRAALTATLVRARLALAALPPAMERLAAIQAAPAVTADLVTDTVTA